MLVLRSQLQYLAQNKCSEIKYFRSSFFFSPFLLCTFINIQGTEYKEESDKIAVRQEKDNTINGEWKRHDKFKKHFVHRGYG
jgi:hypothetical protein